MSTWRWMSGLESLEAGNSISCCLTQRGKAMPIFTPGFITQTNWLEEKYLWECWGKPWFSLFPIPMWKSVHWRDTEWRFVPLCTPFALEERVTSVCGHQWTTCLHPEELNQQVFTDRKACDLPLCCHGPAWGWPGSAGAPCCYQDLTL